MSVLQENKFFMLVWPRRDMDEEMLFRYFLMSASKTDVCCLYAQQVSEFKDSQTDPYADHALLGETNML